MIKTLRKSKDLDFTKAKYEILSLVETKSNLFRRKAKTVKGIPKVFKYTKQSSYFQLQRKGKE